MTTRAERRHPDPERGAVAEGAPPRADRHADGVGASVRDPGHRRRQHRRELRDPAAAAGRRPAPARHPLPPQLRADGGVRRRIRPRARPPHRHLGRRPAERPARHPGDGRHARARLRHRVRLAEGPEGPVRVAPPAVDARQRADLARDRRAPARLRLLAEGVPRGGREADEAVRRDAPLPAGDRERAGRVDRRGGRQPPRAAARPLEVRHLAHGARRSSTC